MISPFQPRQSKTSERSPGCGDSRTARWAAWNAPLATSGDKSTSRPSPRTSHWDSNPPKSPVMLGLWHWVCHIRWTWDIKYARIPEGRSCSLLVSPAEEKWRALFHGSTSCLLKFELQDFQLLTSKIHIKWRLWTPYSQPFLIFSIFFTASQICF